MSNQHTPQYPHVVKLIAHYSQIANDGRVPTIKNLEYWNGLPHDKQQAVLEKWKSLAENTKVVEA